MGLYNFNYIIVQSFFRELTINKINYYLELFPQKFTSRINRSRSIDTYLIINILKIKMFVISCAKATIIRYLLP